MIVTPKLSSSDPPEGQVFRDRLALRERARKSFSAVDNLQALRRAAQVSLQEDKNIRRADCSVLRQNMPDLCRQLKKFVMQRF